MASVLSKSSVKYLDYVFNITKLSSKMKGIEIFSIKSRALSLYRGFPLDILAADKKDNGTTFKTYPVRRYLAVDIPCARSLFQFQGKTQKTKKEYAGRKLVGYSMEQMFDVVADVENYSNFVPFCKKSVVTSKTDTNLKADLVIGFPPVVESYTSNVSLLKPSLVKAVCTEGKLFHHLLTTWRFSQGLKNNQSTCIIDFFVSFEFRSPLHSQLANFFFNELVRQMENAFYDEAENRYGKAAIRTRQLSVVQNKNS